MARNRVFRRRYVIEFRGISTNDFMPAFLDRAFDNVVKLLDGRFKQLRVVQYSTEDLRTGGMSNLTEAGVQVNLFYKGYGGRNAQQTEGSQKGEGRPHGRQSQSQQLQKQPRAGAARRPGKRLEA